MFFGARTSLKNLHNLTNTISNTILLQLEHIHQTINYHHRQIIPPTLLQSHTNTTLSIDYDTQNMTTTRSDNASNAARRLKEKKEAEKALDNAVAESDKKREEEKKRRAEAKAAEEAKAKAIRDEERRKEKEKAATPMDKTGPSEGINALLTELATGPGDGEVELQATAIDLRNAEDSPEKKKKKQTSTTVSSSLKTGRYSAPPPKVSPPPRLPHNHVHSRVIIDAAMDLDKADPINSFTNGLSTLINNAKMVDEHFVIAPVRNSDNPSFWHSAGDIPNNMTAVSSHINISANNIRNFEKQRNWDGPKKEKEAPQNSTVYFSFAISCDIEPTILLARVGIEWTRAGGSRLMVKALPCFDTISPLVFYYLFNDTNPATLVAEFKKILTATQMLCIDESDISNIEILNYALPEMAFRKMIPKIPGQDTSAFKHISTRAQYARRAWHLEVEVSAAWWIKELVEKAKYFGVFEAYWGRHVHVTEITSKDTSAIELKRLASTVNLHTNYQCSLTVEILKGVVNVDAPTKLMTALADGSTSVTEFTLREIMLKYFKMSDGHSLIGEVHQRVVTSPVEVVIPASEEAETMLAKMNKHFPAFIYYYLQDKGMSKEFATNLVSNSCCPTLTFDILECSWDSEQLLVTTKDDAEEEEKYSKLETAKWFKDEIGLTKGGKKNKKHLDPTLLYDLDGDRSVKTLHERNDATRKYVDEDMEGDEEVDSMSTDSASDSDIEKSHHDKSGKAGDTAKGVSFAAGSSEGPRPRRNGAAGSG